MNAVEREYNEIKESRSWGKVYSSINQNSIKFNYATSEAQKPQNRPLNRYRDVHPYDHSRIILQRLPNDYINANLIKLPRANRQYILTQGPLAYTISHFWLMVWEQNSRAILMLNKVIEKNEIKCHFYWPQGIGDDYKIQLDDVQLTIEQTNEEDRDFYYVRYFRIYDMQSKSTRDVIQFHYTTWPDFGVPSSPKAFLEFLNRVRETDALSLNVGPAIVHCSAGIGRSGTFCLVDTCLIIIEKEGIHKLNVQDVLIQMRRDRMGLIQTPDQLRFSYEAIIEGAKSFDPNRTIEQSPPFRYNFTEDETEYQTPPQPPRRSESLYQPTPNKPLPPIPVSASYGDLSTSEFLGTEDGSLILDTTDVTTSTVQETDDEVGSESSPFPKSDDSAKALRMRNNEHLAQRLAAIRTRLRETERSQEASHNYYVPLSITVGVILTSVIVYSYLRH